MSKLSDIISRLAWSAPLVLAARQPTSMAACYDMSFVGVEVLKRFGLNARLLPCVVIAKSSDGSYAHCLGLNESEIRARAADVDGLVSGVVETLNPDHSHHHVAIEVKDRGARVVVDLTIGQLRRYGVPTPFTMWGFCRDWPTWDVDGWHIQYEPSPRLDEAIARAGLYAAKLGVMIEELEELIRHARQYRNHDDFFRSLRASNDRITWSRTLDVMNTWMELGSRP